MAKLLVEVRIFPESAEVDLEALKKRIVEVVSPEKIEEQPIAFGLVALRVFKITEEKEGVAEELEKKLKEIEGVGEAEVVSVSRTVE